MHFILEHFHLATVFRIQIILNALVELEKEIVWWKNAFHIVWEYQPYMYILHIYVYIYNI